jgi:SAM-dependent methyltransferase
MSKKTYTYAIDNTAPHLGGNFIEGDPATFCPSAWEYIIDKYRVKKTLDVGSGRGFAAKWFVDRSIECVAIDGLQENVDNSIVPAVLHDLTNSSYLDTNIDFVNCVEVVEHIEEKYLEYLLDTLCSGKILLMTHAVPGQEGWHHVNCQESDYWINHLKRKGFILDVEDSKNIQWLAKKDGAKHVARNGMIFKHDSK